jgi:hypothetical protein
MSLITKTGPVGMNWHIQQLQTKLHSELVPGTVATDQYRSYGLCYRNKKDNGYVAENFEGGNEYKELYWDDTLTMISFFGLSNNIKRGVKSEADIHLVVFADLVKLGLKYQGTNTVITHRPDEELRQIFTSIIGRFSYGFTHLSTELWLENVLREYAGSYRSDRLKTVDMHPVHCFRMNLKLLYDQNKIC